MHVDPRRATPTTRRWSSERSKARRPLDAAISRHDRLVGSVVDDSAKRVGAAVDEIVNRLAKLDDPTSPLRKVDRARLDPFVAAIYDTVTDVIGLIGSPPSGAALGNWRRRVVAEVVQRVLTGPAFTVGAGGAGAIAALVADAVFAATRVGRGVVEVVVATATEWPVVLEKVTGVAIGKESSTVTYSAHLEELQLAQRPVPVRLDPGVERLIHAGDR